MPLNKLKTIRLTEVVYGLMALALLSLVSFYAFTYYKMIGGRS
jgi:hypothetical protein